MSDNIGDLLAQRGQQWGDAIDTHVRIAKVWDAIANREEITALKVALMMEGLKLIRGDINPDDPDSFHDGQGYSRIAELIAGHRDSLGEEKPAPTEADPTCDCFHPKSAHRDAAGNMGWCTALIGDRRCGCVRFGTL